MTGSRFDPGKCPLDTLSVAFTITDLNADEESLTHRLTVENATIHHDTDTGMTLGEADVAVTLDRAAMVDVIVYPERLDERIDNGTITIDAGDKSMLEALLGALDTFISPNLVEP
jgi:alkyl sulfatase BDS1-like metallo-beta-lactamase superfamily hydrolase